jgi:aldose 1-epimerase
MKTEIRKFDTPAGEVTWIKLINDKGAYAEVSTLGAGIVAVGVPDKNGVIDNIALGYADAYDYMSDGPCMGKIPGRYANRIAKGKFVIDGEEYNLAINNGPNALHGGPTGFQNRVWDFKLLPCGVRFTYTSADNEEGYPGKLSVTAEYVWSENNILDLYIKATTDKATVVNLTNHTYWNLGGADSGSVLKHLLTLKSSHYLPTDDTLIPTGELATVEGTPMDFRVAKELGKDIEQDFPALKYGKGCDNCWAIDGWKKGFFSEGAVRLEHPDNGRVLEIGTTQPGLQVYTGNWLAGSPLNRSGKSYNDYEGVAIELQGFPDAPNKGNFPTQSLRPEEKFDEHIRFSFKTK